MAVLISITMGFILGTVYTSFKLAPKGGQEGQVKKNPHGQTGKTQPDMEAFAGDRILRLEQMLENEPDSAEGWAQLGNTFFGLDRFSDAIEAYGKSLSLVPDNPSVLTDMGVMYQKNKQPLEAIRSFDRAIALDPGFETALFNKGLVLMYDLDDRASAIRTLEELVAANPMAAAPDGQLIQSLVLQLKKG